MFGFIRQRAIASLISLLGLVVLVFFLSRLTGDPAALFLPIDATDEMRRQFREIHGLNDPLAVQFWHYLGIVLFSVTLGWLPTSGTGTPLHWILPIGVLFIRPFGLIVQVVRGSMITALSSAYVKTARAKGVRSGPIIFVHALRNAMLPVITVIGDQAAALLNGAVVVETIFGFPGIGKLMIDSILQRDFNVMLAAIMVTALAIFLMNLLIDLAYALLDPRIRH